MKIFKLATFVVAITLFYNCSNDSETVDIQNVKTPEDPSLTAKIPGGIYNDAIFIDYVKAAYTDSKLVKDNSKLGLYLADDKLSSTELLDIHTVLGYRTYAELTAYTTAQASRAEYLNRTYGVKSLTASEQIEMFETGFISNVPEYTNRSPRSRCRARVNAETVVMHVGCVMADPTIVLGILCHGAASYYQYTGLQECNLLPNT